MRSRESTYITLLLIFIGALLLKSMNIYPLIYKSILMIYILLIPGALSLPFLKKTKIPTIRFLLYSTGLSIAVIEVTGVLANFILSLFHITRPLSEPYITWSFSLTVIILIIASWGMSRRRYPALNTILELPKIPSLSRLNVILALVLMPIITIFAVVILNRYSTTIPIYIAFLYLTLVALITLKFPPKTYPAVAFFMSLALLYHTSLVSGYLWGRDIFNEFYIVTLVIKHGKWIPSIVTDPLNSALSITILPVYLSNILDISIVYVFKAIYPLLLAIASPALYELYSTFFNKKISILSVFLIIFSITYYAEIPQMARVMVAELFLALFLLSLFADNDYKLSIVLGVFLMLSHYSTFYFIFFEIMMVAVLTTILTKSLPRLQLALLVVFSMMSLGWFTKASEGFVIRAVKYYITAILKSILLLPRRLLSGSGTMKTSPLHIATMKSPPLMQMAKWSYALIVMFFTVGIITNVGLGRNVKDRLRKLDRKYLPFCLLGVVNLSLIAALILIPPVARTITSTRVFHLALFTSSPFVLLGAEKVIQQIPKVKNHDYKMLTVGLIIFLLLNSGALASFTKTPYDDTSIAFQSNDDWAKFNTGEVYATQWINIFWDRYKVEFLYSDIYGWVLPGAFNWMHCSQFPAQFRIVRTSYIFLRSWNLKHGTILYGGGRITGGKYLPLSKISKYLEDRIYNNGMAEVYLYTYWAPRSKLMFRHCRALKCITTW